MKRLASLLKGRRLIVALTVIALMSIGAVAYAGHVFNDVPADHTFHNDIEWGFENGLTVGCNPSDSGDLFCPEDPVTRAQMMAFFHRYDDQLDDGGIQGPQGPQGPAGPEGPQGPPGNDGADAELPEVIEEWVESADLSGGDNQGDDVEVASIDLGEGEWVVEGDVNLFVPDPDGLFKNVPGCGLYDDGVQFAGLGGASNRWFFTAQGKHYPTSIRPFLDHPYVGGVSNYNPFVVTGPTTVTMVCSIDQSHGGATPDDRVGMAAQFIKLTATEQVTP